MTDSAGHVQVSRKPKPRPGAGGGLEMDDRQFNDWTRLLQHRAGLSIGPERRSFLVSGIRARMRENDCRTPREYYDRLIQTGSREAEWLLLLDRLTVHETCFFRHRSSMNLVAERLAPEAFERGGDYRVWSVGCATGEEAYSLAMQVDACAARAPRAVDWRVTGSDISLPALHHARDARYLRRRLRDIPVDFQYAHCRKLSASHFEIAAPLRERVGFTHLNLRDLPETVMQPVDLIYCQNLLIYYERERRLELVDQLAGFLRPGGVMILGPGEILDWRHRAMEKVRHPDTLAYRRKTD